MDPAQLTTQAAQLPESFYTILGVVLIGQATLILTIVGVAFKIWGRFVINEALGKALHRRVDRLENKKYTADTDDEY